MHSWRIKSDGCFTEKEKTAYYLPFISNKQQLQKTRNKYTFCNCRFLLLFSTIVVQSFTIGSKYYSDKKLYSCQIEFGYTSVNET